MMKETSLILVVAADEICKRGGLEILMVILSALVIQLLNQKSCLREKRRSSSAVIKNENYEFELEFFSSGRKIFP